MKYTFTIIILILKILEAVSQNPRSLTDQEMSIITSGDCEKSIPLIQILLKETPKDAKLYHINCLCLSSESRNEEALKNCNRAIALNPTNGEFFVTRADLLYEMEDYTMAVANYDLAIKYDSNNDQILFARGEANEENESFNEALNDYNEAIRINPKKGEYYASRALLVGANFKNPQLVISDCNKALELGCESERDIVVGFRGLAYNEIKEYEKAIADFNVVTSAQWIPSGFRGYFYISRAKAYYHIGKLVEAKSDIDVGTKMNGIHGDGIRYLQLINNAISENQINKEKQKTKEDLILKQKREELEYKRKLDSLERFKNLEHERKMDSIARFKEMEHRRRMDSIEISTPKIEVSNTTIEEQNIKNEDNSVNVELKQTAESKSNFWFENLIKIIGVIAAILAILVSIKTLKKRENSA